MFDLTQRCTPPRTLAHLYHTPSRLVRSHFSLLAPSRLTPRTTTRTVHSRNTRPSPALFPRFVPPLRSPASPACACRTVTLTIGNQASLLVNNSANLIEFETDTLLRTTRQVAESEAGLWGRGTWGAPYDHTTDHTAPNKGSVFGAGGGGAGGVAGVSVASAAAVGADLGRERLHDHLIHMVASSAGVEGIYLGAASPPGASAGGVGGGGAFAGACRKEGRPNATTMVVTLAVLGAGGCGGVVGGGVALRDVVVVRGDPLDESTDWVPTLVKGPTTCLPLTSVNTLHSTPATTAAAAASPQASPAWDYRTDEVWFKGGLAAATMTDAKAKTHKAGSSAGRGSWISHFKDKFCGGRNIASVVPVYRPSTLENRGRRGRRGRERREGEKRERERTQENMNTNRKNPCCMSLL